MPPPYLVCENVMSLLYRGPEWRPELPGRRAAHLAGSGRPGVRAVIIRAPRSPAQDGSARYPRGDDIFTEQRQARRRKRRRALGMRRRRSRAPRRGAVRVGRGRGPRSARRVRSPSHRPVSENAGGRHRHVTKTAERQRTLRRAADQVCGRPRVEAPARPPRPAGRLDRNGRRSARRRRRRPRRCARRRESDSR